MFIINFEKTISECYSLKKKYSDNIISFISISTVIGEKLFSVLIIIFISTLSKF